MSKESTYHLSHAISKQLLSSCALNPAADFKKAPLIHYEKILMRRKTFNHQ
jgi:hypothetical protein